MPGLFDSEEIEQLDDEANRLLEFTINSMKYNGRKNQRLYFREHDDGSQTVIMITPFLDMSVIYKKWGTSVLSVLVEQLLEEDPVLVENLTQINYKHPLSDPLEGFEFKSGTSGFPVHRDTDTYGDWAPDRVVAALLFIDDCPEEKGPIEVWPGTHTESYDPAGEAAGVPYIPENDIDGDSKPITGPAGSVLLLDTRLVHTSGPNETDMPRRIAINRYCPKNNVDTPVVSGMTHLVDTYHQALIESMYEHKYLKMAEKGKHGDEEKFTLD